MTVPASTQLVLPDILAKWPWPRTLNPHYAECRLESQAWVKGFDLFSSSKAEKAFELYDPSLLASLAYPNVSQHGCRVACDLLFLFGIFDDKSDVMDPKSVQELVEIVIDALNHPHERRPEGELTQLGEMARSFWSNAIKTVGESAQKMFLEEFGEYLKAVVDQAHDRHLPKCQDIESYMNMRRKNVGAAPAFTLIGMESDITQDLVEHPTLLALRNIAVDMLCLANDLYSFNVEQAKGDDHNIIMQLMIMENLGMEDAILRISAMHDDMVETFLGIFHSLPSFGSPQKDKMALEYINGLGNWVRANDSWSFESWRYFGKHGLQIQRTRVVDLLPRHKPESSSILKDENSPGGVPQAICFTPNELPKCT